MKTLPLLQKRFEAAAELSVLFYRSIDHLLTYRFPNGILIQNPACFCTRYAEELDWEQTDERGDRHERKNRT